MTITKKQIRAFMKARYPGATRNAASCSWKIGKSYLLGMSDEEVKAAAVAEIEAWQEGVSTKPEWIEE